MKGKFLQLFSFFLLACLLIFGMNSCKDNSTYPNVKFEFAGKVVDASDNPVEGAQVEAFNFAGSISTDQTDEFGAFVLPNIPSNFNDVKIRISAQGFPVNEYELNSILQNNNYKSNKHVQLQRGDTCKGLVVIVAKDSASGNKLQNVFVKITRNGQVEASGKTGENGKISFGNFCAGEYGVRLSKDGYKVIESQFSLGESDTLDQTFLMQLWEQENCCSQVNVLVKEDGTGNVIAGAQVKLARVGGDYRIQTTNEDGKTSFGNVCDGVYWLRIAKDGYQVKEEDGISFDGCDTTDITIILKKEVECCGQFTAKVMDSATGNALQGVLVKITKEGWAGASKTTSENGTVTFGSLCPGKYWVRISKDGYKVIEDDFTITECDSINWDVKLKQLSQDTCCDNKLVIYPKDAESKTIINGAVVKLWQNGQILKTITIENGNPAKFLELCTGTYGVSVHAEGYNEKEAGFTFKCSEVKEEILYLTKNQQDTCCNNKIIVNVTNAEGDALANAKVKLIKNGQALTYKVTGSDGKVVFEEVCSGTYSLLIIKEGYNNKEVSVGEIKCEETKEVTAQLTAQESCNTAVMKIFLKDYDDGSAIAGATVVIKVGEETIATGTTNAEGVFAKENLTAPKTYTVIISKDGYEQKSFTWSFTTCKVYQETIKIKKQ